MVVQSGEALMSIKWNLNQVMFDKGIKTSDLAASTGLHANTISKLKNLREMPDRLEKETLDKLCKALKVQPGDLMVFISQETKLNDH